MLNGYRVMYTKTRLITTISAILIAVVLVIVGTVTKAQTSQTNTQVILNLENGQQYFGVPHVYQGDYYGAPATPWPVYLGPNNASQYWLQGHINSDQPVLELVPGPGSGGAMFWSETYSGGSITIAIQATASIFGDTPFQVYLFLKPTMWGISPQYNYTIPYRSINPWPPGSDVISPQSSTPYLIIQWNPFWQTASTLNGATGQWNVWIVSNPSGNNASVGPYPSPNLGSGFLGSAGWDGIGTGWYLQPNPGDRINITVTYDPSTNTLSGVATDLSACFLALLNQTVQTICPKATFTLNLSGYFTPPSSGNYVFGVGAATLDYGGNGALLYVATTQQTTTPPSPSLSSLVVQVFNALGRPATTVPGVVFGVLYNSSGFREVAFMNSSGYLNFYGVPPGTYTLEVYHYPNTGFNYTEYWGSETINVQPGYNVVNFTRDEPWIYDLQPVYVNGQVVINVTIDNPLSTTLSAYVYLWVTTNPSTANPNQPTATQPITMHPGLNKYTFHYPASQTGTYYVYAAVLTYINTYTVTDQWGWTATTLPQNYQVVLNLLNGQQYFGVPHVYMGYYSVFVFVNVTTQWPAYYSPLNASLYWSLAGISSNQPVLELMGATSWSSGAMYWPTYYEGGNITISFITVYTTVNSTIVNSTYAYLYTSPISVYLFIKPLGWGISSMYNFSIPCARPALLVNFNLTYGFPPIVPMIPWSTANYLIVTWFPANQNPWTPANQNPWTIEVVNTTSTYSLTLTYLGGNGIVKPKPGDLLNVTITYNPNTNTIYGMIRDINTSETSTFTASLSGNFTPPSSGYYVFGIGTASEWVGRCGTACCSCTAPIPFQANWALLYAAASQQPITPSPKGSLIVYVPVWYNGTTYYVYWSVKGISATPTEGSVSPSQFLQLFLQLNSSHAIMKFEGITYQNGTPITNTAQEELILGYLYLWLLLGSNWKTIVQNYGTTSAGYQFLSITTQSGVPTVIETANGITNSMYYLLDVLDVIEGFIEGNNQGNNPISKLDVLDVKATFEFFKVSKLILSHELQDEFGNQKAQEIEELFKQYHLQASNYIELLQEFSSLPPSEQENLIASLYEITTGQTLPNPTLKAADILINRIISKGVSILVESYADSLYESLTSQGVDQYFASLVLQNFESDLQNEISDSILSSSSSFEGFLLLTVASIIENAWNIPNEVVYSIILTLINNLNYNYEYLENYINAYETSSVANLTLASQLYSAMILNNLWWSEMWHNFYSLPWPHPNNDYLIYSNMDYNNAIDTVLTLSNLMVDASFTLKWGYIPPIFILDQNIYTPIVPQYSSFWNSFLEHLISLKEFTINGILTVIRIFGDPPLAIINVNSTFILLNGTKIYTNNPFAFTSYQNNSYLVVLPISNITYLGIESNETTHAAITPLTNKTTIFNVTLSPYNADVLKVVGSNVSIINTTISINTPGMVSLTGKNNLSFVWLSNGNLVIRGLPPGQYVVQNPVTNTTIQQIDVSSQNTTTNAVPIWAVAVAIVIIAISITILIMSKRNRR